MIEADRLSRIYVSEVNREENWVYFCEQSSTHPEKEWNNTENLMDLEDQFHCTIPEGRYDVERLDDLIRRHQR